MILRALNTYPIDMRSSLLQYVSNWHEIEPPSILPSHFGWLEVGTQARARLASFTNAAPFYLVACTSLWPGLRRCHSWFITQKYCRCNQRSRQHNHMALWQWLHTGWRDFFFYKNWRGLFFFDKDWRGLATIAGWTQQFVLISKFHGFGTIRKSPLPPSILNRIYFSSLDNKIVRPASSDSQNRSHNLSEWFEGEVAAVFLLFYFD